MTQPADQPGPGVSPGSSDDEVTVTGREATVDAPVQDGAQELREEAEQVRSEGVGSRADTAETSGAAVEGEQTKVLDDAAGNSGGDSVDDS